MGLSSMAPIHLSNHPGARVCDQPKRRKPMTSLVRTTLSGARTMEESLGARDTNVQWFPRHHPIVGARQVQTSDPLLELHPESTANAGSALWRSSRPDPHVDHPTDSTCPDRPHEAANQHDTAANRPVQIPRSNPADRHVKQRRQGYFPNNVNRRHNNHQN